MTDMRIFYALAGLSVIPATAFAQAGAPSQTVTVTGQVAPACVLGAPAQTTLNINPLTGSDGRLTPALIGSTPAVQTTIANAWCNTPSDISVKASPLTMVTAPAYAQQTGFARAITYTAALSNWSGPVSNRPLSNEAVVTVRATAPQAAAPSLGVTFSNLAPLIGGAEQANAFIEAGAYKATIQISLAAAS